MSPAAHRIVSLVAAIPLLVARGPAAQEWAHEYGDGSAGAVAATPDGGFIVAGITKSQDSPDGGGFDSGGSALLMKLDASGEVEWSVALGSPRGEPTGFSAATVLADGYLCAGQTEDAGGVLVARFDLLGDLVWQRTYAADTRMAPARALMPSTDGQFFIAFNATGPTGSIDSVLKLAPDGAVTWHRGVDHDTGTGPLFATPLPVVGVAAGGVVMIQTRWTGSAWLARLVAFDALGTVVWAREFGGAPEFYLPTDLAGYPDGSLALAGGLVVPPFTQDSWIARTDASGTPLWQARYGIIDRDDWVTRLVPAVDGGVMAIGSWDPLRDSAAIARLDATGGLVSSHVIAVQASDMLAIPGGLVVAGPRDDRDAVTVARLDVAGHATTSCLSEISGTLESFAAPVVSTVAMPVEHAFATVPVEATLTFARLALVAECVAGCTRLESEDIYATPGQPCPGAPVSLQMGVFGGEGSVTVAWDLDGDGITDVVGNPVVVTAPSGPWRIMATATDECAAGPQSCAEVLRLTVSAPLGEVSDVLGGGMPLTVRAPGIVSVGALPGTTAYNLYIGRIGTWYDSDAGSGVECAVTPLANNGDGTITLPGSMPPGSWILVTASNRCFEGAAGTDSFGVERASDPSWAGCGPAP